MDDVFHTENSSLSRIFKLDDERSWFVKNDMGPKPNDPSFSIMM